MARVDGKPKRVSERYLGTAEEIAAAMAARDGAAMPQRSRHLAFGDVASVWRVLERLDVVGIVDAVVGARRADAAASTGTYLALAALNRVVAPCSKAAFADWWVTTAADRFTRVPAAALDHRRFWDAMRNVPLSMLTEIERRITSRMIEEFDLDVSALALDMTNFATYIDTTNDKAPSPSAARPSRNAPTCDWSGSGWSSPATAACPCSPTPTPATGPTSPSSPR